MSRTKKSKPGAQQRAAKAAAAATEASAPADAAAPAPAADAAPASAPAESSTTAEAASGKKGKLIRPRGKRGGIKHHKKGPSSKSSSVQQSAVKESRKTKEPKPKTASQDQIDSSAAPIPPAEHASKIAKFHTLLKQLEQAKTSEEKDVIQEGLDSLGGLAQYQAWSLTGSAKAGQTPTSKWCIEALNSVYEHSRDLPKFRILDVGAITGTAYTKYRWIDATSIDLHPQGEHVEKYSFFDYPLPTKEEDRFNMVALSLVVNFVGDVRKRGEMLRHVHKYLKEDAEGFCFLVLPLSCLTNSRYMNQSHLRSILDSLGFEVLKQSDSARLSRWLLKRKPLDERRAAKKDEHATDEWDGTVFKKRDINPGQDRNNFAIVVDPVPDSKTE
ncbi:25S rRNA (adenine(2142)-N(1))-methyltransferase, Bmt2 [Kalmanozyma brasiliensis GHG001]|uniref:25S rRNA adenine-N(1) methyltransferase n=1 Tax=Kalmanozyma brasiliensis (strain GHG001) TaxID=1365824 RepID=V5EVG2_KALBG|nr:25S rRNA (adenine(2142)-N(1))-methyltransferase, Bmt2 [Kalmanozyma brasiliensis GHG001]EST06194.1 25S rRNA (adenine(2142)-N(1))-methyltransferase, Bmt2 [Kalmanozyma brasiliensis GHG001]